MRSLLFLLLGITIGWCIDDQGLKLAGLDWHRVASLIQSPAHLSHLSCEPEDRPWIEPTCKVAITPRTMLVRFVTEQEYESLAGEGPSSGIADPDRSPCEIVFPAHGSILAWPDGGQAKWDDSAADIGNVMAHEMLHCLAGYWHLDPPRTYFRNIRWKDSPAGREDEFDQLIYVPKPFP